MVLISGGKSTSTSPASDLETLTWAEIHSRTRTFYEHYRAVLTGEVDDPDFDRRDPRAAADSQRARAGRTAARTARRGSRRQDVRNEDSEAQRPCARAQPRRESAATAGSTGSPEGEHIPAGIVHRSTVRRRPRGALDLKAAEALVGRRHSAVTSGDSRARSMHECRPATRARVNITSGRRLGSGTEESTDRSPRIARRSVGTVSRTPRAIGATLRVSVARTRSELEFVRMHSRPLVDETGADRSVRRHGWLDRIATAQDVEAARTFDIRSSSKGAPGGDETLQARLTGAVQAVEQRVRDAVGDWEPEAAARPAHFRLDRRGRRGGAGRARRGPAPIVRELEEDAITLGRPRRASRLCAVAAPGQRTRIGT